MYIKSMNENYKFFLKSKSSHLTYLFYFMCINQCVYYIDYVSKQNLSLDLSNAKNPLLKIHLRLQTEKPEKKHALSFSEVLCGISVLLQVTRSEHLFSPPSRLAGCFCHFFQIVLRLYFRVVGYRGILQ